MCKQPEAFRCSCTFVSCQVWNCNTYQPRSSERTRKAITLAPTQPPGHGKRALTNSHLHHNPQPLGLNKSTAQTVHLKGCEPPGSRNPIQNNSSHEMSPTVPSLKEKYQVRDCHQTKTCPATLSRKDPTTPKSPLNVQVWPRGDKASGSSLVTIGCSTSILCVSQQLCCNTLALWMGFKFLRTRRWNDCPTNQKSLEGKAIGVRNRNASWTRRFRDRKADQ